MLLITLTMAPITPRHDRRKCSYGFVSQEVFKKGNKNKGKFAKIYKY